MSTNTRRRPASARKIHNKLDYETKLKIYIKFYKERPSISSLASEYDVSRTTIKRIIQDTVSFPNVKSFVSQRSAIWDMEKLLTIWIEDRIQRNLPISANLIQAKAIDFYKNNMRYAPSICTAFKANDEWFEQYRLRMGYKDLKLEGAAICDMGQMERFSYDINAIINAGGYLPEQIFNVDRLLLFWKSMPDGTFISQQAEKIASDRLSLVLGYNAMGDCKLKPLIVYRSQSKKTKQLPINYRYSSSAWLTIHAFEEWFLNDFITETKEYCQQNGIPFKILLILDTTQTFNYRQIGRHPNVKVVFFPRNTARQLQPMDQGIKSIFKAFYYSHVLKMVTEVTQGDSEIMVQDFCELYNIRMGVANIKRAWEAVSRTLLATSWNSLCPNFFHRFHVALQDNEWGVTDYDDIKNEILFSANQLGFEMNILEVESLIQSIGNDLSYEDLLALSHQIDLEEASNSSDLTKTCDEKHSKDAESTEYPNIATACTPKQNTSNEDDDSIDSRELVIDCIKVEEPELVEPSVLNTIPQDSMKEEKMDFSESKGLQAVIEDSSNDSLEEKPLQIDEGQSHSRDLPATLIAEEIELAFDHVTCAMEKFANIDPNQARFRAVRSAVNDMLSCYREMLEESRQNQIFDDQYP